MGFVFLCFLICDYTTRHVRCQDTYVYWCKEIRCTIRAFDPFPGEKLNKSEKQMDKYSTRKHLQSFVVVLEYVRAVLAKSEALSERSEFADDFDVLNSQVIF